MSSTVITYRIPTTNAEGMNLVLTVIYRAELARRLNISRAALTKWKEVPIKRVDEVSRITGLPREHILPEMFKAA